MMKNICLIFWINVSTKGAIPLVAKDIIYILNPRRGETIHKGTPLQGFAVFVLQFSTNGTPLRG
jgi:hypothetical protein